MLKFFAIAFIFISQSFANEEQKIYDEFKKTLTKEERILFEKEMKVYTDFQNSLTEKEKKTMVQILQKKQKFSVEYAQKKSLQK